MEPNLDPLVYSTCKRKRLPVSSFSPQVRWHPRRSPLFRPTGHLDAHRNHLSDQNGSSYTFRMAHVVELPKVLLLSTLHLQHPCSKTASKVSSTDQGVATVLALEEDLGNNQSLWHILTDSAIDNGMAICSNLWQQQFLIQGCSYWDKNSRNFLPHRYPN